MRVFTKEKQIMKQEINHKIILVYLSFFSSLFVMGIVFLPVYHELLIYCFLVIIFGIVFSAVITSSAELKWGFGVVGVAKFTGGAAIGLGCVLVIDHVLDNKYPNKGIVAPSENLRYLVDTVAGPLVGVFRVRSNLDDDNDRFLFELKGGKYNEDQATVILKWMNGETCEYLIKRNGQVIQVNK